MTTSAVFLRESCQRNRPILLSQPAWQHWRNEALQVAVPIQGNTHADETTAHRPLDAHALVLRLLHGPFPEGLNLFVLDALFHGTFAKGNGEVLLQQ